MSPSSMTIYRANMLPGGDFGNPVFAGNCIEAQFPDGRGNQLKLTLPSNNSLNNKSFRVRISGTASSVQLNTFAISLYFGISTTIASNTLLYTTNPLNLNIISSNFEMWADCFWSANGLITGMATGQFANQIFGPGTFLNTPTADPNRDSNQFLQSGTAYGFTVTGKFTTNSTFNHAAVTDFSLEST